MTLSVTEPISRAINRTREILFEPFDIAKWFKLGFCAFLAHLADSSGGGASGNTSSWQESGGSQKADRALEWLRENWELVVGIGIAVAIVILAIVVLLLWLQGRGRFMFLDGVVRNRGAVVEPWHTYRAEGHGVFWFKLCFSLGGFFLMAIAAGIGVAIAWPDIDVEHFGGAALGGLIVGGGLFLMLGVSLLLIDMFLNDFVVPAMYARRIGVMEGWAVVRNEVFAAHGVQVVLYVLMKILIKLIIAALVIGLVCVTFCVAACFLAIPYIGTVLMLPLLVFSRCYSLYFLDQLGGEWRLVSPVEEAEAELA